MPCVDCDDPVVVRFVAGRLVADERCASCLEEVAETPNWQGRSAPLSIAELGALLKRETEAPPPPVARAAATPESRCLNCGDALPRPPSGQAKMYCTDRCKSRAAYARRTKRRLLAGDLCSEAGCPNPRRTRRMCRKHYNIATGNYIRDVAKDPERERARLRLKTHRRHDFTRLTDITPEYEMALRAKAKRCPLCRVNLLDEPYLPASKELDHIIPQGAGGTHTIGNVRIICRRCNIARPKDGSDYTGPVTLWAEVA